MALFEGWILRAGCPTGLGSLGSRGGKAANEFVALGRETSHH
jgi:hypothetical protein